MSKRPLIYEVIDLQSNIVFSGQDKAEGLRVCRELMAYSSEDYSFRARQGKKVLFWFGGLELAELLEDEDYEEDVEPE